MIASRTIPLLVSKPLSDEINFQLPLGTTKVIIRQQHHQQEQLASFTSPLTVSTTTYHTDASLCRTLETYPCSFYEALGRFTSEGLILVLVPVSANRIVWILSNPFILHSSYITHLNNIQYLQFMLVLAALLAKRMQSAVVEALEY
jgi:hypothetical protein